MNDQLKEDIEDIVQVSSSAIDFLLNITESSLTRISFTDNLTIRVEGGLSDLIGNDALLMNTIEEIFECKANKNIWGNDNNRLKIVLKHLKELKNISKFIYLNYDNKLNTLKKWIIRDYENKKELINKFNIIIDRINDYYDLLPQIYYREKDRQLESSYKYDDIKNIFNNSNHIFHRFLLAAGIKKEEIVKAFEDSIDGSRRTIRNTIEEKIKKNIEAKFNDFYDQEKIKIQIEFENRIFKIYVLTDSNAMNLNERSNGLRWYLSLFIDILSYDYKRKSSNLYNTFTIYDK